jgi:hypothetical protein
MGVRRVAISDTAPAKHLRLRREMDMELESDDRLISLFFLRLSHYFDTSRSPTGTRDILQGRFAAVIGLWLLVIGKN